MLPLVIESRTEGALLSARLARTPIVFRFEGTSFTSLLVKADQHPARFLSTKQIEAVGAVCQEFLAPQAPEAVPASGSSGDVR